jgi:hypothetical protein
LVEHLFINQKCAPSRNPGGLKDQKNRIVPKKSTPGPNQKRPRISGLIEINNALRPNCMATISTGLLVLSRMERRREDIHSKKRPAQQPFAREGVV